jgi:hypothetical protein
MTSILERAARPQSKNVAPAFGLPQVNLLPPEISARRALSRVKKLLGFALVVVLGLVALAYVGSLAMLTTANNHLADAEGDTARLTAEAHTYAEVPKVLGQLSDLKSARDLGFSTDIPWQPYIGAIFAVLPAGVQLGSLEETGANPMVAPGGPGNPLEGPSVSRIAFAARSTTMFDTADWVDRLEAVPGFTDAWVSDMKSSEDEDGTIYYAVQATVLLTDVAYVDRFADEGN